MNSPIGAFFCGVVAVILLALFSASTFYLANAVLAHCAAAAAAAGAAKTACAAPASALVGEGFIYVVTTVAGLVSALVIAQLSVTESGKPPTVGSFTPESRGAIVAVTGTVGLYLAGWIATGLAALVIGVMVYPKVDQTLGNIGSTWLGLAVSAAYAYFGISPTPKRTEEAPETFDLRAGGDLVLGQKVPNATETATSGAITKKIKRTDPEFAQLVSNTNTKIVFKDEEGTGADRMMSSNLQGRLDALADLVAAEWSGTKLRITEAWDENNEHTGDSLHYEGRAADITTDPQDGTKLGRLGRLAVDAGCDWVYFEDSSHIHVSVKV